MRADSVYVCCQLTIVTYVVSGAWVGMTSFCAVPIVLFLMLRSICLNEIQLRDYWYLDNYCLNMSRFGPAPFQCTCNANNSAYTHTAILPPPPLCYYIWVGQYQKTSFGILRRVGKIIEASVPTSGLMPPYLDRHQICGIAYVEAWLLGGLVLN